MVDIEEDPSDWIHLRLADISLVSVNLGQMHPMMTCRQYLYCNLAHLTND